MVARKASSHGSSHGSGAAASVDDMDLRLGDVAGTERKRRRVAKGFWLTIKRVSANLPFVEEALAAYYCAFDRQTPRRVQVTLIGALAYFVLPFDFLPDVLPVIGFTDDAAVLATAIRAVAAHITPQHREAARAALARGLEPAPDDPKNPSA